MGGLDWIDSLTVFGWFIATSGGLYLVAKKESNNNKIKKAERFFEEIASRNK